jgi:hypothetical protein
MRKHKLAFVIAELPIFFLLAGCRSLAPEQVQRFAEGVTDAKIQTGLAFQTINLITRESLIDYAARQPALSEKNLFTVLEPEAIRQWEEACLALEKYAQHLFLLTSPQLTEEYKKRAIQLAGDIQSTGEHFEGYSKNAASAGSLAAMATGFIKLSELLIRLGAQGSAVAIAREVDPTIQNLFKQMADVIGPSRGVGLRGTAWAQWTQRKAERQQAFLTTQKLADKRILVAEFFDLSDQQASEDATLASLERSLRSLARAHQALAAGDTPSLTRAVAQVESEIRDTRRLYDQLKQALEKTR